MNKNKQEKIYKRYPDIFKEKDLSCQETNMCWGIACGDGWEILIYAICNEIENIKRFYPGVNIVATQVKEKFGGLRFYYRLENNESIEYNECEYDRINAMVDGAISIAESLSYAICEKCGSTDQVKKHTNNMYIRSLCKKCRGEDGDNV